MDFTDDGFVVMTKAEFDVMAAAVAKTEVAGKGKEKEKELSEVEKRELKARIMAEPNQAIRQKLIRENMNLFR